MRMFSPFSCVISCMGMIWLGPAQASETLANGRITAIFGGVSAGVTHADYDRLDSFSWINSQGVSTGNVARAGGSFCGDPQEFFGQSYGVTDGTSLYLVIGGSENRWKPGKPAALSGTSAGSGKNACATQLGSTRTQYTLSRTATRVNALHVQRSFRFFAGASGNTDDLRSYVPRFPWATVFAPDAKGVVQTYNVGCCGSATPIPSWNGAWFAEDDGAGNGVAVIRDKSSKSPAYVALDNDSLSNSNNTSIVLNRPASGWSQSITETQWLCFYDPSTWPAAKRNAGKLPTGCAVPVH